MVALQHLGAVLAIAVVFGTKRVTAGAYIAAGVAGSNVLSEATSITEVSAELVWDPTRPETIPPLTEEEVIDALNGGEGAEYSRVNLTMLQLHSQFIAGETGPRDWEKKGNKWRHSSWNPPRHSYRRNRETDVYFCEKSVFRGRCHRTKGKEGACYRLPYQLQGTLGSFMNFKTYKPDRTCCRIFSDSFCLKNPPNVLETDYEMDFTWSQPGNKDGKWNVQATSYMCVYYNAATGVCQWPWGPPHPIYYVD